MFRVRCPRCKELLEFEDAQRGTPAVCPQCGTKFRVPAARTAAGPTGTGPPAPASSVPGKNKPRAGAEDQEDDAAPRAKKPGKAKKKRHKTIAEAYSWGGLG